jgi:glycosyltransferase involved in cell wall biosynthesis
MTARSAKQTVLVIGPASSVGGMATSMRLQLSSSLTQRYQIIPFDNSKRTATDRRLWQGIRSQLYLACELFNALRRHRPDIVHLHTCSGLTFYRSMVDMLLAKWFRAKVIMHIRGGRFEEFLRNAGRFGGTLARSALRWADRVIALNQDWAERIAKLEPRARISVVQNGVVVPARLRQQHSTKKIGVVFVGNLRREKGVDDLLSAVAELPKTIRATCCLRLVGPDPYDRLDELQQMTRRLGIEDTVEFCGTLSRDDTNQIMARSEIFVLPSYAEGFPNALLEAMACGLPSIACDVGAIPDVIEDGVNGFMLRPGDRARLSECLKQLIRDPDLRKKFGRAARKKVRREFDQDRVVDLLDRLYREMLHPAGGAA